MFCSFHPAARLPFNIFLLIGIDDHHRKSRNASLNTTRQDRSVGRVVASVMLCCRWAFDRFFIHHDCFSLVGRCCLVWLLLVCLLVFSFAVRSIYSVRANDLYTAPAQTISSLHFSQDSKLTLCHRRCFIVQSKICYPSDDGFRKEAESVYTQIYAVQHQINNEFLSELISHKPLLTVYCIHIKSSVPAIPFTQSTLVHTGVVLP